MEGLNLDGWEVILLLYFTGVGLVFLEVFVPGLVLGLLGVCVLLFCCYLAYQQAGLLAAFVVFVASCLGTVFSVVLAFRYLPRTSLGRKWIPATAITGVSNKTPELNVGDLGIAETHLRPVGIARFKERRYDVESLAGMIEQGTRIRITRIEGSRILVVKD